MLAMLGRDEPAVGATVVAVPRPLPTATATTKQPQPGMQRRRGVWGAAAGVGALVVVGTAYVVLRSPAPPPPASRPEVAASTPAPASVPAPPQARPNAPAAATDAQATRTTDTSRPPDAVPAVEPAPMPPVESPKREAIVVQPSAAAPTPARARLPGAAPTVAPAPPPPAEPPQRQAIVVPPPAPAPAPTTAPSSSTLSSPLERARTAARSLPCSVLRVASGQDGLHVSGLAQAGQELDRLLTELRDVGNLADDITRVDRFACTPIATMAAPVRQTWDTRCRRSPFGSIGARWQAARGL